MKCLKAAQIRVPSKQSFEEHVRARRRPIYLARTDMDTAKRAVSLLTAEGMWELNARVESQLDRNGNW